VRCDIVGRDQGGFVREAQKAFEGELASSVPEGYRVSWLGMFENLEQRPQALPRRHPDHRRADLRTCRASSRGIPPARWTPAPPSKAF